MRTSDTREALTREIADTYQAIAPNAYPHATAHAYHKLQTALRAQFDILSAFVDVRTSDTDPYPDSAAMFQDIARNRALTVYTSAELPAGHPMSDLAIAGDSPLSWNTVFRAVHDGLAHYPGRHSFGARGEWRAFQAHARLIGDSDVSALHALFTETITQNAWYQVHGMFAPQKSVLMPWNLVARALALEV